MFEIQNKAGPTPWFFRFGNSYFVHLNLFRVSKLVRLWRIRISKLRVSTKWVNYGTLFPNFQLPFLGTDLMRRDTSP